MTVKRVDLTEQRLTLVGKSPAEQVALAPNKQVQCPRGLQHVKLPRKNEPRVTVKR